MSDPCILPMTVWKPRAGRGWRPLVKLVTVSPGTTLLCPWPCHMLTVLSLGSTDPQGFLRTFSRGKGRHSLSVPLPWGPHMLHMI